MTKKEWLKIFMIGLAMGITIMCSGCASLGMLGVEQRAIQRGEQEHNWWVLLQQGRITMEDYAALKKLQGPLTKWYE